MQTRSNGWVRFVVGGALGLGLCFGLAAQTMYKHVDAAGRVTFSDKPPSPSAGGKFEPVTSRSQVASSNTASLPLEVRQAAERYPVVLFTGPNCEPCETGRQMLNRRGIPFGERTVATAADGEALRRLSGDQGLPMLTIGGQQIKGYSDIEWDQFLTAAGYPSSSQLPPAYKGPPAAPLVATAEPSAVTPAAPAQTAAPATARAQPAARAPAERAEDTSQNPAGIKF